MFWSLPPSQERTLCLATQVAVAQRWSPSVLSFRFDVHGDGFRKI
jgi:hypothetical protein